MNYKNTSLSVKKILACLLVFGFFLTSSSVVFSQNKLKTLENSYEKLRVFYENTDFKFRKINTSKGVFAEFQSEGMGFSNNNGLPKLPVLKQLIEIPVNAVPEVKVINYTVKEISLISLGMPYRIIPAQPPISKNLKPWEIPFVFNETTYNTDAYSDNEIVHVENAGFMRGTQIGHLEISPIRYNPVKGILRIYENIEIEINFKGADIEQTIELKNRYYSPYFEKSNHFLFNYKNINDKANLTQYPVKYVIVSDPMFQSALQPFVAWKTKKGFTVIEAYTDNPSVGTTTASIKAYLKGLYDNASQSDPAPSFVLFVGDVAQIPAFNGTAGSHITDLPYCEYTGDFIPEAYYGRFSATNLTELQPQIDKTLEYEQFLMPDPSFLGECVMISGVDGNYAQVWGNGQINYGTTEYFNSNNGLTSHTYLYPASGSNASQIIQDVSNGCAFANYTAHGDVDGWSDPAFSINNIASLNNAHKYPLMVGNCCLTNTFGNPACFGEALLRAEGKGALGYIGGSNTTTWDEDFWWGVGYRASITENPTYSSPQLGSYDRTFHMHGELFSEWFTTQGQMVSAGNLAVEQSNSSQKNYYWEVYHLMGDPSLSVYFGVPSPLTATYNSLIPLGANTFTINTEPYAYAALSKDGILHGATLADSNGIAEFVLTPFNVPGVADVVITKQNREPFFGTLIVQTPSGPYVLYNSNTVNDATGNNNSLLDYNEDILLDVALFNIGVSDATTVDATLSTSNTYVTITDSAASWGTIPLGDTISVSDAFAFSIADNIPDQTNINFMITVNEGTPNSWDYQFSLKANAPSLTALMMKVNDSLGGNNNKRLDPGETVDLIINTKNIGHSDIENVVASLTTSSPYITINNATDLIALLSAQSLPEEAIFNITVAPSTPVGTQVVFDFDAASGSYSAQKAYSVKVGLIAEDWENGTFGGYSWVNTSAIPWIITNETIYEGLYAAKSGAIGDDEQTVLEVTMDCNTNDTISFYRKVSSENNYDFLEFYINNVKKGSWSGEKDWERFAYPTTTGSNIFKWVYKKDSYLTDGSDCAWIDFITFPSFNATKVKDNSSLVQGLSISPNPANNQTVIRIYSQKQETAQINITNMLGQTIYSFSHQLNIGLNSIVLNTSGFESGVYICTIEKNNEKFAKKLIISK